MAGRHIMHVHYKPLLAYIGTGTIVVLIMIVISIITMMIVIKEKKTTFEGSFVLLCPLTAGPFQSESPGRENQRKEKKKERKKETHRVVKQFSFPLFQIIFG